MLKYPSLEVCQGQGNLCTVFILRLDLDCIWSLQTTFVSWTQCVMLKALTWLSKHNTVDKCLQ